MNYAPVKLGPEPHANKYLIRMTRLELLEATNCLEVLKRYSPETAIARQLRYIERIEQKLANYLELQSGS